MKIEPLQENIQQKSRRLFSYGSIHLAQSIRPHQGHYDQETCQLQDGQGDGHHRHSPNQYCEHCILGKMDEKPFESHHEKDT